MYFHCLDILPDSYCPPSLPYVHLHYKRKSSSPPPDQFPPAA